MSKLYAAICIYETIHSKDITRVRFMIQECDNESALKLIHFADDEDKAKAKAFVKRAEMGVISKLRMKHYYGHATNNTWIILSNSVRHLSPREHIPQFMIEFKDTDIPTPRHPEGGPLRNPHPGTLEGYEDGYITELP